MLMGCATGIDDACFTAKCFNEGIKEGRPYYTVYLDNDLERSKKTEVIQALNDWEYRTNYYFRYNLIYLNMANVPEEPGYQHSIRIFFKDFPPVHEGGSTTWHVDTKAAVMFIKPWFTSDLLREVVTHELGHALNLTFENPDAHGADIFPDGTKDIYHYYGPYKSIMNPSADKNTDQIECPELRAFCRQYDCDIPCKNELAK